MALTPEERRAINRQNAQHSTGPKSPEGKERARQNALKHGLRAETLALPGEDPETLKARTDEWLDYYQPASPGRRALLDRALNATLQMERCARFHAAAVAHQVRAAEERWDREQGVELERLKNLLNTDPPAAVFGLKRLAIGCRWLLEQWGVLMVTFAERGSWAPIDRDRAIRLLGAHAEPDRIKDSTRAFEVRYYNLFARANPSAEAVDWLMDPKRRPGHLASLLDGTRTPEVKLSRAALRDLVAGEVAGLKTREEPLRREIEAPGRAGAADRALLLEGAEGSLYLRYEKMHDSAFHRALKVLEKGEEESPMAAPAVPMAASWRAEPAVSVLDITAARPSAAAPNEASAGAIPEAERAAVKGSAAFQTILEMCSGSVGTPVSAFIALPEVSAEAETASG